MRKFVGLGSLEKKSNEKSNRTPSFRCWELLFVAEGGVRKNPANRGDLQGFSLFFVSFLVGNQRLKWSWRESNPRPNKVPKAFYTLSLDLIVGIQTGARRPIHNLSSFISTTPRSITPPNSYGLIPLAKTSKE